MKRALSTGYGTVLAGSAARVHLGRVALDAGVIASRGREPGQTWESPSGGFRPFPWLGVGLGL